MCLCRTGVTSAAAAQEALSTGDGRSFNGGIVSIESQLTEHWEKELDCAQRLEETAQRNLTRMSIVYSGQLSLWKEGIYKPTPKELKYVGDRVFTDIFYPKRSPTS